VTNAPDATKLPKAGGTMTGDTLHGDNVKAKFGTGDDLQIYHDGSNSYINENGVGSLYVKGAQLYLQGSNGENYLEGIQNGGVTLYSNNVAKLATTSTGVSVTGTVAATAFTGDGSALTNLPGGGKVLQVVSVTSEVSFSTSAQTMQATGTSATITPTSSTSKILVIASVSLSINDPSGRAAVGILRGSVLVGASTPSGSIRVANSALGATDASTYTTVSIPAQYLDSPSTTSSTTYNIALSTGFSSSTAYLNRPVNANTYISMAISPTTITLMEIGA